MEKVNTNHAFITKSNFEKIAYNDDGRLLWLDHLSKRYEMTFKELLSDGEIYKLNVYAEMLMEFEELAKSRLIYIKPEKDELNFIFPPRKPSFHTHASCRSLNKDYKNLYMPQSIKALGGNSALKFREYFQANQSIYEFNPNRFQRMVEREFKVKIPKITPVHRLNSGVTKINNTDNSISAIKKYAQSMTDYKNSTTEVKDLIERYGNKTHTLIYGNKIKADDDVLQIWHDKKKTIKDMIRVNLTSEINPQLKFKTTLLEQLGFQECATCK